MLWTKHKNSTENIALQATSGETSEQVAPPKCSGEIIAQLSKSCTSKDFETPIQSFVRAILTLFLHGSEKNPGQRAFSAWHNAR